MKNMTPVILGLLMLTSFFAGVDFYELEEQVVIEEAGARAGGDPSVIAITTPKETTCDNINGCRNTLQVGDATTFAAYIKNSGDADITELSYSVTIYLADLNGNPGNIAKDSSGSELRWQNVDAMCDDASICDFDSSATPLSAGAFLGGGKLTLQLQGGNGAITWTPSQGQYVVEVAVSSPTDGDASNNNQLVYVVVEDWHDIEVDVAWTTGENTEFCDASGGGACEFTLTVTANGSENFSPRNVVVRLDVTGQVATATAGGDDLLQGGGVNYQITAGTSDTVRTFEHETDPFNFTEDSRSILTYQTPWSVNGELTPNGDSEARFTISAELVEYTVYGQYSDCEEVIDGGEGNETNSTTLRHFCEVTESSDDRPKTDYDEISGSKVTFDDIRISRMGVFQGYNFDDECTGTAVTFTQEGLGGELNVGCGLVYADVEHRGSDTTKGYNWNISYTITHDTLGVVDSGVIDECVSGVEMPYTHVPLGGTGDLVGSACVFVNLEPGEYTFDFTLNMDTKGNSTAQFPWDAGVDQRPSNNDVTMVADVLNNLPVITSFELVTEGDIVVGQPDMLQFTVSAFDVDDPSGNGIFYQYNYQGGAIGGCNGTQTEGGPTCSTPVLNTFIGNLIVTVVVTDAHSGQVSQEMSVDVWNDAVATATSDAGITIEYPLQYFALSEFTIATFVDADASEYSAVPLEGFTGTYAAVAALNYAPSTTFPADDILAQELSVIVDTSLEATSLWYIDGSNRWILFSDASTEVDATTEMFTYDIPDNSPVVPAGKLVLMGGELAQATIPVASVSGFSATAEKGGAIALNWNITGTLLSTDSIHICVSPSQAVSLPDCPGAFNTTVNDEVRSYTYSGSQTTHGETYYIEVAVCNEQGCSTPGLRTVVADKQVDGDYTVSLTVGVASDGVSWDVSWTVTGDTSDVDMWHICWVSDDFDAANMPSPCPDSAPASATNANVAMPVSIQNGKTYYFTVVGMDNKGNMDASAALNEAQDTRTQDNSNIDDGNGTIGDGGDDASAGVPTWTWGLIGGVVIVAFVAGAFILSRGDGPGGEGKDWDY